MLELVVALLMRRSAWSRPQASAGAAWVCFLAGLVTVLSFNVWANWYPLAVMRWPCHGDALRSPRPPDLQRSAADRRIRARAVRGLGAARIAACRGASPHAGRRCSAALGVAVCGAGQHCRRRAGAAMDLSPAGRTSGCPGGRGRGRGRVHTTRIGLASGARHSAMPGFPLTCDDVRPQRGRRAASSRESPRPAPSRLGRVSEVADLVLHVRYDLSARRIDDPRVVGIEWARGECAPRSQRKF